MLLFSSLSHAAGPVIDATRTVALSSAEVVAMGGAGLGFATGANGMFFSPGAPANRKYESRSALGASLALNRLRIGESLPSDVGNLGRPGTWSGAMTNVGLGVVFRNAGIGIGVGSLAYANEDAEIVVSEAHLGGGGAVWDGRVAFGAGWRLLTLDAVVGDESAEWVGVGLETGLSLNGVWDGWNIGFAARTPVQGSRASGRLDLGVDGVAVPWELAAGVGWYDPRPHTPRPWRVAADVVVDGPVAGGMSLESLLDRPARDRGHVVTVEPHLGIEATLWPERLRWRAGAYLEPARAAGSTVRPHGTSGFELRLFHLNLFGVFSADVSWEAAVDVAPDYLNVAWLGVGLWQRGITGVGWERPERGPHNPDPFEGAQGVAQR